jgi:glycosyltransferase involved in cell wall biosynthesis
VQVVTTVKYRFDGHLGLDLQPAGYGVSEAAYLPARYRLARGGDQGGALTGSSSFLFDVVRRATRRLRLGLGLMTQTSMLALRALLRECLAQHQRAPFDVVVSTSGPEVCTFVAHAFATRTGVPWIADYRDLWFQEFAVQRYGFTTWLTGTLNKRMLRRASAIVTVSEGLASYLRPIVRCPVWVCYNGYLEKPLGAGVERPWNDGRTHVVYTGNFYSEKRDPGVVFAAMQALFAEQPSLRDRVRLDIYGPREDWVRAKVRKFGLDEIVLDHGMRPYAISLRAQACADALLFVDWMDPAAKGVLTGKLFEYLAAGRPILNVAADPDSEASQLIRDAQAGEPLIGIDAVRNALHSLAVGTRHSAIDLCGVARYSRSAQADALLDRITALLDGAPNRRCAVECRHH